MKRNTSASNRSLKMLAAIALGCVAMHSGCGGGAAVSGEQDQLRAALKILGLEYGKFLAEHNAPPKDEAAMRDYLQSRMSDLSAYGVKNVDDLLRHGRDGQPLQVIYGQTVAAPDKPEYPWAAYEQSGVDGMRLAVNVRGGVQELGAAEFSQQIPIK